MAEEDEYGFCPNCKAPNIHISELGEENGIVVCKHCYQSVKDLTPMADIEEKYWKKVLEWANETSQFHIDNTISMKRQMMSEYIEEEVAQAKQNGIQEAIEKTIKEFLTGKRCINCGDKRTDKEMKNNPHTDTCPKCWEEE